MDIADKLPGVGTTIFTVMSRLAVEHGAVNLGQGIPDFQPPPRLVDLVEMHMRAGLNQYAPMAGDPRLRERIAADHAARHGVAIDPEHEVTITAGGTEALFCAVQAAVGPGDEVVLLDPAYDSYAPAAVLAGARVLRVPLTRPDFQPDWEALSAALSPRTRLLVVNNPNNPTGQVLDRASLDRLAALLEPTRAWLLADEVYERLTFDGRRHATALAHPGLRPRCFAVYSFGKVFDATGWKVGYCIAPPQATREFRKVHQFVTFAVNAPVQRALADFLAEAPGYGAEVAARAEARRNLFGRLMTGTRLRLLPSHGTYFQLVDYSAVSLLPDLEFCRQLVERHGVAVIPLSPFQERPSDDRLLRCCFAKEPATLELAAERLAAL